MSGTERYCWVAMSLSVTTVSELATWPVGVSVPVGLITTGAAVSGVPDAAVAGGVRGLGAGTTRREPEAVSGGCSLPSAVSGALTSTGGNKFGDADCCADAAEICRERTGTRKVEASRNVRRRVGALMREEMVGPRYDVSGTSQRTKSHPGASATFGEANVCTPRPTSS